jgi:hypothetical protein
MDEMGVPGYVGVVDHLGLPELTGHAPRGAAASTVSARSTSA